MRAEKNQKRNVLEQIGERFERCIPSFFIVRHVRRLDVFPSNGMTYHRDVPSENELESSVSCKTKPSRRLCLLQKQSEAIPEMKCRAFPSLLLRMFKSDMLCKRRKGMRILFTKQPIRKYLEIRSVGTFHGSPFAQGCLLSFHVCFSHFFWYEEIFLG